MSKTVQLAIFFNEELRGIKELPLPFVIGRSQDVALSILHPMVSRRHCTLFEEEGRVCLRDLGSLNGTYSDGKRITEVPLNDNDSFSIGSIRFSVKFQEVAPPEPIICFDSDSAVGKVTLHETHETLPERHHAKSGVCSKTPPHAVLQSLNQRNMDQDMEEIDHPFSPFSLTLESGNGIEELHDVIDLDSAFPEHFADLPVKKQNG
ncbi:MAG: FHA domain-containing protein [Planctomycetaceae bacterium]|nr:FHA domain-containing protein [Planctomycetaceae bacterium]